MIFTYLSISFLSGNRRVRAKFPLSRWPNAILALLVIDCLCAAQSKSQTVSIHNNQTAVVATANPLSLVGVGSCTAAGCHGGAHSNLVVGSEYNVWIAQDPHARAYSVLFEERSQTMVRLLDGLPLDRPVAAYKDARCLACHSTTDAPPREGNRDLVSDGVGCESCHGPASRWLSRHYEQPLTRPIRQAIGMVETKDLLVRAQICVRCHVGGPAEGSNPTRDVNHDLIAAGHPRLQFEMSAYHEAMPKHWSTAVDPKRSETPVESRKDFEALVWAVGQACASQAALEQLASRAGDKKNAWPEFAEWSCSACHHALRGDRDERPSFAESNELPGRVIEWDNWNHYATRLHSIDISRVLGLNAADAQSIENDIRALDRQMGRLNPNRKEVAAAASKAAARMKSFAAAIEGARFDPLSVDRFSKTIVARHLHRGVRDWSSAVQVYDALASLQQTKMLLLPRGDPRLASAIRNLYEELAAKEKSPAGYVYKSKQIDLRLTEVQSYLPTVEGDR